MVKLKTWRIIPRPLLETVLNNHVQHHLVPQPLILHGPRGVGKTTLIRKRLFDAWNKGPHITGYVDFSETIEEYHPKHGHSYPWASWTNCPPCKLVVLKDQLEKCLESMITKAIRLGAVSSHQIFSKVVKWHSPTTVLSQMLNSNPCPEVHLKSKRKRLSASNLWDRAVFKLISDFSEQELDSLQDENIQVEDISFCKEAMAALKLAKKVIVAQQKWREVAIRDLNTSGRFSRSLANSSTDWPCLLLELLSSAAEMDYFQPKLVINNIEVLKNAITEDDVTICGSMYHDSLIWRIVALGAHERCLPVILVTSDGYYSYQAFMDFGFPDVFISRETFGWTPAEAQMHMVDDYFSQSEWSVIVDALGSNPRHLFELHMLKSRLNSGSTFDVLDLYLAYLQITVVNPAMDKALLLLEKFSMDAQSGKISKDRLSFGAPWRHPPRSGIKTWVKIQMMDFVQSLVVSEFGVNYLADSSLEFFDDPAAVALLEVGLLYTQRDPSFIRPVTRGIERCLVRWLVQEQISLSVVDSMRFSWQRVIRGRSYRHLMLQEGYNKI